MQKFVVDELPASRRVAADADVEAPYDVDFAPWLGRQVAALRSRRLDAVDRENLIQELESMGKRDRRELASRVETLLIHLLKCEFQPQNESGSWLSTLREQRSKIGRLLNDSPSRRDEVERMMVDGYAEAVDRAALETGISTAGFPSSCGYTVEQMSDPACVP